jgi:hypothetical protein
MRIGAALNGLIRHRDAPLTPRERLKQLRS